MYDVGYRVALWCDQIEDGGGDSASARMMMIVNHVGLGYGDGCGGGGGGGGYGGDGYGDGGGCGGGGGGYGGGYGGYGGYGDGGGYGGGDYGYGDGGGGGGGYGKNIIEVKKMDGQVFILHCNERNDIVGRVYADHELPMLLRVESPSVIRYWGTKEGLGQLAREGPLDDTVLDPLPSGTLVCLSQVVYVIHCDEAAWADKLHLFGARPHTS